MKLTKYPDNCYAVQVGRRRGPVEHDKPTAIARFRKSGLIASASTDKRETSQARR